MDQGRLPASDSLHWSALLLQQHKLKKSRNNLLDLFRVNICPVCSFPEKEKSCDSVTMNAVRSGQGLGFTFDCIPCLLILPNIYLKIKYTLSLNFHMTCQLRSYSFLKVESKVLAHRYYIYALWKTLSKSCQGWHKSYRLDILSPEISPNSITQGKGSEPFQGRGLCHRWQRLTTDGRRQDLEENNNQEWDGSSGTGANRLWIEEEGWYRKSLNMKLSPASRDEDTTTKVVAHVTAGN